MPRHEELTATHHRHTLISKPRDSASKFEPASNTQQEENKTTPEKKEHPITERPAVKVQQVQEPVSQEVDEPPQFETADKNESPEKAHHDDWLAGLANKSVIEKPEIRQPVEYPEISEIHNTLSAQVRDEITKDMTMPLFNGKTLSELKFAVVKQNVYANVYCTESYSSGLKVVESTVKHLGPYGLFGPDTNAEFIMVDTKFHDPDTDVWYEKIIDCKHKPGTLELAYDQKNFYTSGLNVECSPMKYSVDIDSVDWGKYDVVVSFDTPVNTSITLTHPKTVWAYFVTEGCMSTAKSSLEHPHHGYDLYLTQDFHLFPNFKEHVIEFPFTFTSFGMLELLAPKPYTRKGMILCRHHAVTDEQRHRIQNLIDGPVEDMFGKPAQLIERMIQAKYFLYIRADGGRSRGNAVAEAMGGGCLVIGTGVSNDHAMAYTGFDAHTVEEAIQLIEKLEADPELYAQMRQNQVDVFNHVSYNRPLYELVSKGSQIVAARG